MKYIQCILAILALNSTTSFSQNSESESLENLRAQQVEYVRTPGLWDMERMQEDIKEITDYLPLRNGAFPVPHYDSLLENSYKGGGVISNHMARSVPEYRLEVGSKEVVFCSFFIGDSPLYQENDRNKVFFTVLTVIDTVSSDNFALGAAHFLSRNHPDYGGEGSFISKKDKVDFVAFTTPDKGSFALVNMRLFHMEHGNIILVTPQKDGSFRSLQIKGKDVSDQENFNYLSQDVLNRKDVIEFLTSDGTI